MKTLNANWCIMHIENSLVISIIHDYGVEKYSSKKTPFHPFHNKFQTYIYFGRMKYYDINCKKSQWHHIWFIKIKNRQMKHQVLNNHLNGPSFHKRTIYILEMVIYELFYLIQTFGLMSAKY